MDEGGGDLKGLSSVYHRPPGQHNAPPGRHGSPAPVPAVRWPKPENAHASDHPATEQRPPPRPGGGADTIAFPTSPDAEPRALREVVEGIQRIPSAFTDYAVGW